MIKTRTIYTLVCDGCKKKGLSTSRSQGHAYTLGLEHGWRRTRRKRLLLCPDCRAIREHEPSTR